ncbi:hypothetical protein AGMMS50255_6950 [Spirochaetia bacterium]|nr:hypothetical protein AGMMS50255_6950 [Spirochaetia bacterium]
MKTIQDYMTDPRIINDPSLEPVKEIHAARLMLQDEMAGMTDEEKSEYINKKGKEFLDRYGLSNRLVNLSEQGKLRPRVLVEA